MITRFLVLALSASLYAVGCGSDTTPSDSDGNTAGTSSGGSQAVAGAAGQVANGGSSEPAMGGAPNGGSPPGLGGAGGSGGSDVPSGGQAAGGEAAGGAGGAAAGAGGQDTEPGPSTHDELILHDDDGKLWYVNNVDPDQGWDVETGNGRDLQLIGDDRVMLGKGDGWDEYQLSDGARVGGQHGFSGTQSAHRLADGTTMLASVSGNSIVLRMVTADGDVDRSITYDGYGYVRLVRPTAAGTFLVTADTLVFEGDENGQVLATWSIPGSGQHVWKAMRLANGNTVIATGYNATLMVYGPDEMLLSTIGGKDDDALSALDPHFFADFHVRPNGNYFVVNSQADSNNRDSVQLLEFDPQGELAWQQKQPPSVRSVEAAIVLDGLDTSKLQIEPEGVLMSAP